MRRLNASQLAERECALKVVDEQRIDPDEIIAACKTSKFANIDKATGQRRNATMFSF